MRPRRMPWKETGPFEERRRFVETCRDSDESFGAIGEQFGISRQKGYKRLGRFEEGGLEGLVDRSRRPHSNSRAVPPSVVELIIELRKRRPRWGPRKLLAVLERDYPKIEFPAASTVGSYGVVRRFQRSVLGGTALLHPLTISDGFSRFLLWCTGLKQTLHKPVQKAFHEATHANCSTPSTHVTSRLNEHTRVTHVSGLLSPMS